MHIAQLGKMKGHDRYTNSKSHADMVLFKPLNRPLEDVFVLQACQCSGGIWTMPIVCLALGSPEASGCGTR